jgi:hypothetical protein
MVSGIIRTGVASTVSVSVGFGRIFIVSIFLGSVAV